MKQKLWVLNSTLLLFLILAALTSFLLHLEPPIFKVRPPLPSPTTEAPTEQLKDADIKEIIEKDLFSPLVKPTPKVTEKSLVTPIPEPKLPTPAPYTEPQKPDFLPPLNYTVKGLVFSGDEEKSIVMIADNETNKESVYHLGDSVGKGGQIIKISKNKVTLLRDNGQHEIFYLRRDDNKAATPPEKQWEDIIRKVGDNAFEVDRIQFPKRVESLGHLLELLSCVAAYSKGKSLGLKIGNLAQTSVGPALGLQAGDIITSINGLATSDKVNRVQIYEKVSQMKNDDVISVDVQRNGQNLTLSYKLTIIKKTSRRQFVPTPTEGEKGKEKADVGADLSRMNEMQEREKRLREFNEQQQQPGRQSNIIEEIRQRLLENMRARAQEMQRR